MGGLSRKVVWGLIAGVAVGGGALAQPPVSTPPAVRAVEPDPVRVADPLGAMLSDAKTAYSQVRDYTCVFTRQERVGGVLGVEQVAEMKVHVKPASIAVRFARPDAVAGMEMIHTAGTRAGKMKYRPATTNGNKGVLLVSPDDPKVMAQSRHSVTDLGVGSVIDLLAGIAAREKILGNPVEVFASDYRFAGRTVTRYEIYTRRPHAHRYAYQCLVYVDKETKLPVRFEAHDSPKPGTNVGDLLEAYSYTDVKLNVGLGDSAFE